MTLFCWTVEPLLEMKEEQIYGIKMGSEQKEVYAYVDVITIILTKEIDVTTIEDILKSFEEDSNLRMIREKTKMILLGTTKEGIWHTSFKIMDRMKILGIWFRKNLKKMIEINWNKGTEKI